MVGTDDRPDLNLIYRLATLPTRIRIVLLLLSLLLSLVIYAILHPLLGDSSGLLALFTGLFAGLLFGVEGGLIGSGLVLILEVWIIYETHGRVFPVNFLPWAISGSLVILITGGLVGYLARLQVRYLDQMQRRIEADQALDQQRQQYRQLINHAQDGIFLVDETGLIIEWNPRMEEITGLPRDQVIGNSGDQAWVLSSPYDRPASEVVAKIRENLLEFRKTGRTPWLNQLVERSILTEGGCRRFTQGLSFAIETERGFMLGGILRDVTAGKLAEQAETEQRAFVKAMQEVTNVLNRSLRLEEVLEQILIALQAVVPHDAALVLMVTGERAKILRYRSTGSDPMNELGKQQSLPIEQTKNLRTMSTTRQPYRIPDIHADPDWVDRPGIKWLHAYLGVPIVIEDQVAGFLSLMKAEKDFFTATHAERLQAFAAQAGIAIRNARLFEAADLYGRQLDRLNEITHLALSGDSYEETIRTLTSAIGEMFQAEHAFLLRWDEENQAPVPISGFGPQSWIGEQMVFDPQEPTLVKAILDKGEVVAIPHVSAAPFASPRLQQMFPNHALLGMPLIADGKKLGVALITYSDPREFAPDQIALAQRAAGQIALALSKIQALEVEKLRTFQLARNNAMITALSQVTTTLSMEQDPQRIMESLGEQLKRLNLECLIATADENEESMSIAYLSIESSRIQKAERLAGISAAEYRLNRARFPWFERVIDRRSTVFSEGPSGDLDLGRFGIDEPVAERILELVGMYPGVNVIYTPLVSKDRVLGTLWLWGASLRKDDQPAATLFANQVAAALDKARLYVELERLAITDSLTGLYNRRGLWDLGQREVERAERFERPLAAVMLDLDHFKQINDRYGHPVGDEVLITLASICRANLREIDVVGRYGGEEILILLPEARLSKALGVAERLRAVVAARPVNTSAGPVPVTISLGVTAWSPDLPDFSRLVSHADLALYQAKNSGRNCVCSYSPTAGLAGSNE